MCNDGTISPSARRFLEVLREPAPADELAKTTGFPMFRVRSALREMEESGLVSQADGRYQTTAAGAAKLAAS